MQSSWARQLGLRIDDAADLVQEVLVVLVEKLDIMVPSPVARLAGARKCKPSRPRASKWAAFGSFATYGSFQ